MSETVKNNSIEDELNIIRVSLYEQTKDMSVEEKVTYLRALAKPINEEFGITPVSTTQAKTA